MQIDLKGRSLFCSIVVGIEKKMSKANFILVKRENRMSKNHEKNTRENLLS